MSKYELLDLGHMFRQIWLYSQERILGTHLLSPWYPERNGSTNVWRFDKKNIRGYTGDRQTGGKITKQTWVFCQIKIQCGSPKR